VNDKKWLNSGYILKTGFGYKVCEGKRKGVKTTPKEFGFETGRKLC
jgi:hypothetical protein